MPVRPSDTKVNGEGLSQSGETEMQEDEDEDAAEGGANDGGGEEDEGRA